MLFPKIQGIARDKDDEWMLVLHPARRLTDDEMRNCHDFLLGRLPSDLLTAAKLARSALDNLMGDTDLPDDDSQEMKAMQALNAAIATAES